MNAPLTISGWMRYDVVRRHIEDLAPSSILEFGVGLAGISSRIVGGRDYYGVEPDDESRRQAQQRLPGHHVVASLDEVPVGRVFDLVCAFEVIEHIEDHHAVAKQWAGLIRPGGHLLLSAPADSGRYGPWDRAAGHFRRYDRVDAEALVEAAGLDELDLRHYGYPVGNVLEMARNRVADRSDRVQKPMDEVTADSARQLQPTARTAPITQAVGSTLARAQRSFEKRGRGTGLVLLARRPT
ncbi:MAG: SAM-dependent methyltransferase [Acidimicrobiales bacterium]